MRRIIIMIFFPFLILNCIEEKKSENKLWSISKFTGSKILYADYTENTLKVLSLETSNEISISSGISEQDNFLFWGEDKVLLIQPQGSNAAYIEYNFIKNNKTFKEFKAGELKYTAFVTRYKDSILIISDLESIYCEALSNEYYDTIRIQPGTIYGLECSNTGILAILFTDGYKPDTDIYERKNLMFYDLLKKRKIHCPIHPYLISDWSINGNYLVIFDSVYKKLEFPSFDISEFNIDRNTAPDLFFISDSIVIYTVDNLKDDYIESEDNIFSYDLQNKKVLKQITNTQTRKVLFDVYPP